MTSTDPFQSYSFCNSVTHEGTAHTSTESPDWKKGDKRAQKTMIDTDNTQNKIFIISHKRKIRGSIFKITKKTPIFFLLNIKMNCGVHCYRML